MLDPDVRQGQAQLARLSPAPGRAGDEQNYPAALTGAGTLNHPPPKELT
jgi:hypothetical protein